jgi:hypothetical protein
MVDQDVVRSASDEDDEPEPFHKFNVPDKCGVMEATLKAVGAGVWSKSITGPSTYDVTTWDAHAFLKNSGTDT